MIIAIIDVMERALNDLLTQTGGVIGSIRDEQLNFGKDIFIPHTLFQNKISVLKAICCLVIYYACSSWVEQNKVCVYLEILANFIS